MVPEREHFLIRAFAKPEKITNHMISDAEASEEKPHASAAAENRLDNIIRKIEILTWMVGINLVLSVALFGRFSALASRRFLSCALPIQPLL